MSRYSRGPEPDSNVNNAMAENLGPLFLAESAHGIDAAGAARRQETAEVRV